MLTHSDQSFVFFHSCHVVTMPHAGESELCVEAERVSSSSVGHLLVGSATETRGDQARSPPHAAGAHDPQTSILRVELSTKSVTHLHTDGHGRFRWSLTP
ncbi:hypothetical protein PINS_up005224 [Pythium insidiosum]|nr:hypothetical protein PINS_up005224 [Pythium insidiosum]